VKFELKLLKRLSLKIYAHHLQNCGGKISTGILFERESKKSRSLKTKYGEKEFDCSAYFFILKILLSS